MMENANSGFVKVIDGMTGIKPLKDDDESGESKKSISDCQVTELAADCKTFRKQNTNIPKT